MEEILIVAAVAVAAYFLYTKVIRPRMNRTNGPGY